MNKLHIVNLAVKGVKQLQFEAKKLIDNFTFLNTKLSSIDSSISSINDAITPIRIPVLETLNLIPTNPYAEVTYDTDKTLTITKTLAPQSDDISFDFVDPEDISQELNVTYNSGIFTITHSTDETGAITTLASDLNNAIELHVGYTVTHDADAVVDFTGSVALNPYVSGDSFKEGELFTTNSAIYIALEDMDGDNNTLLKFKKVNLTAVS